MTADYVAYHAAERPDAVAVVHNGRAVSFAELSRDIRTVIAAVRALGVRPGGSVAVGTWDFYLHWLLLLACERLGIATASLLKGEGREAAPVLAVVDLVLASPGFPAEGDKRHHVLTPSWLEEARARLGAPVDALPAKMPEDPVRIVRTSGTTAQSKCFPVTRRMHDLLTAQWQWGLALDRHSRYLQTLLFQVRATYDLGCACLRAGGTIILESRMTPIQMISAYEFTHVVLLPVFLKTVLDELPPDFAKPRDLTVVSFGAALSDALRKRAMERLATVVGDHYGAVEVGNISEIRRLGADGFGTLWPHAQAEAVDERDQPVPLGKVGRLRLRTPYMSKSYVDDPATTARMFRDGWFYPGDAGTIQPGRKLQVLGRADDQINIGGLKLWPVALEDALLKHGVAEDVGVSSITDADGLEMVCIAVSRTVHGDEAILDRIMRALGGVQIGTFRVVKLERIPRSANGKLQRQALRDEMARWFDPR